MVTMTRTTELCPPPPRRLTSDPRAPEAPPPQPLRFPASSLSDRCHPPSSSDHIKTEIGRLFGLLDNPETKKSVFDA